MAAQRIPIPVTPEEYLLGEESATTKSEYHNGVIIAMAGGNPDHNELAFNIAGELKPQMRGGNCRGFSSDQRVSVPRCNKYYYPDVVVACGELQFESIRGVRSLQNPTLVVEVLSPSTEEDDRSDKFACYTSLPSLQVYMLVSQARPRVETYTRQQDGFWQPAKFDGLDAVVPLPSLGCELRLADIYGDIIFPPQLQNTNDADGGDQA